MDELKMEYLAMRKEMKQGYGQHTFEQMPNADQLRRKCISVLNGKCRDYLGRFKDNDLQDRIEKVVGIIPQRKISVAVIRVKALDYPGLVALHSILKSSFGEL